VLVNAANIVVIIMLIFLSYPLSFFGSDIPDRVVKVELLRFLLRGPGTGLIALAVIIITTRRDFDILGLSGDDFTPFAVVAMVLLWQWSIHLGLPYLEKWLIYGDEDDEQLSKLQDLSDRVLTRSDLNQLIEATLEATCDYLRTDKAFVAAFNNGDISLTQSIGDLTITEDDLQENISQLQTLATQADHVAGRSAFFDWESYQIVPLYSRRTIQPNEITVVGIMGIHLSQNPILVIDDEDMDLLYTLVRQAEQTLDDLLLQDEIFAALEGLLPQFNMTRTRADEVEYKHSYEKPQQRNLPDTNEVYELVRAALRHYWGGAGIARSRLLELGIVQSELESADTAIQAMRNVIQQALERLRPEGERSLTEPEWTLYNIIDLRFIEGRKVRDVARRMSMSEPDLYRKQRQAIETIAESILTMERDFMNP
jgi:hypothetical protein